VSQQQFKANGKLLLFGEYFVLDGALSLAVPSKQGQSLNIRSGNGPENTIKWESWSFDQKCWFSGEFKSSNFKILSSTDMKVAQRLQQILQVARKLNPSFIRFTNNLLVQTHLEFPRKWGLGTSSTLIANISKWAEVDPYQLLSQSFGGSGYDIACAHANQSILYQRISSGPTVQKVAFNPPFKDQLYFIYLGKKQNSREGIQRYRERVNRKSELIETISVITREVLLTDTLSNFEDQINRHEQLVSDALLLPKVKDLYFSDYWGSVKSLGAWGGDFAMATSASDRESTIDYFRQKGFETILSYDQMVKYSS